jgi:4-cresol dehydrogenase (hydroxylating) flavoprotein subunit
VAPIVAVQPALEAVPTTDDWFAREAPDPPADRVRRACAEWAAALGAEHVSVDDALLARLGRSTGPADLRPVAVVAPSTTEEVQAVVRIAARHGVPLHAISRGKNWGYGDACPPGPGQALVDLRRMTRILEVNAELAYCVIEPGVTQGQLEAHLRASGCGLWMDATGAGPEASLVGNTLDRGFGHTPYGDHFGHTCGMEVVLADGRVLRTGFGHYEGARAAHAFRYGVGPILDGLFSQSGLGIVTRIGLWLMPAPQAFEAFFIRADDDEDLAALVDTLRPLRLHEVLRSAIHIGNDLRVISGRTRYPWDRTGGATPLPDDVRAELRREHGAGAWNVAGALYGTAELVAAARRALRRAVRESGRGRWKLVLLDERKLRCAEAVGRALGWLGLGEGLRSQAGTGRAVLDCLRGVPTEGALPGAAWRVRGPRALAPDGRPQDPLDANAGLMWISPVAPATGAAAREVMDVAAPIFARHGFEPLVTFTLITPRALCCVTNVAFDRREPEEMARATACYDELTDALMARGYIPYRTGPRGWKKLGRGSSVFWDVARDVKRALDPRNIMAPGRYDPLA